MVPTAISSADVPAVAAPSTPTSRSGDAAAFGDALGAAIADGGQETAGAQTPPTRPGPAPAAQDAAAADPSTAALVALLGRMAASGAKAGPAATTRTGDAPAADPHAEAGPAIADALGTGPAAQEPVAAAAGDTKAVADGAPAAAATAAVDPALLAIAAAAAAQAGAGAAPTAPQAAVTASGDAEAGVVRLGAGRSTTAGTAAAPSAGAPTDSVASGGAAAARPASADDRRAVRVEDAAVGQPDATGAQQPALAVAAAQQAPDLRAHAERAAGTPDSAATAALQPATAPAVGAAPAPAATAAPAAPAVPPTLAEQVHEPLVALRHAPEGDHVVVVRITPEHLGTVTVHATVHRGDLSVQLFASSSDARDQLKGMLTDLRRDLGTGGVGTATTLSLGTGDAPQQDTGRQAAAWTGSDASSGRPTWTDARGSAPRAPAATADQPAADLRPRTPGSALLDVLA